MSFDRNRLPDWPGYLEAQGMALSGPGPWKTTSCQFHGGSDSMRINTKSGGWVCMSCGVKGGDVLSYHMKLHGLEFVDAAKALGAWIEDGNTVPRYKSTPLSPRSALEVMAFEANFVAIAAGNVAHGVKLSDQDLSRLLTAAGRINRLVEGFV